MIRFYCEHCANKISVRDKDVGKQGKCPKCGSAIVVPAESTIIDFHCENCDRKISVPKINAGKKAICPKCSNTFIIPATQFQGPAANQNNSGDLKARSTDSAHDWTLLDVPEQYKLKDEPAGESNVSQEAIDRQQEYEETESTDRRKLPWILDIFLYPISTSGMAVLGIIVGTRFFFRFTVIYLGKISLQFLPFLAFFGLMWAIGIFVRFVLYMYLYWYLCECIRDSAAGSVRAPETFANTPGLGELLWKWFRTVICLAVFAAPTLIYYGHTRQTDTVFWALLACGLYFFPMGLLAVVLFDSLSGLNPILLIGSIFSTFLPYSVMILTFIIMGFVIVEKTPNPWASPLAFFTTWCVGVYLLMIVAHLLGWFCHRYKQELNWEV